MAIEDTIAATEQAEAGDPPKTPSSLISKVFKVLAGLVVAASFSTWVYVYSGQADRPPPDLFDDTSLAARAEALCTAAVADVEAMPGARDAVDAADRAGQIRVSTARFETMVDDLAAMRPTTEEDRIILDGFVGDWRTMLRDRLTHADVLLDDPTAQFLLSDIGAERLDRRMTRVANTNAMYACVAPTDVG